MSKGYWILAVWLLVFFNLLWAKLPGLSWARGGFLFKRKGKGKGIEVLDIDGQISRFFSPQITEITVQELKPMAGGSYTADRALLRSKVKVKITRPDMAELHGLNPDMEDLLLRGSGQIAIVTGVVKGGKLEVEKEFLKGTGRGAWEIQTLKK